MTYFYAITHSFLSTKYGMIGHASVCRFTSERTMRHYIAQKLARSFDTRECTEDEVQRVIDAKMADPEIFGLGEPTWKRDRRLDCSPLPWEFLSIESV